VFESLTDSSLDEPFAVDGLLADSVQVADDELAVTYHLNPKARFADGQPVTADDVVFSYTVLRSEAAIPTYRAYYRDIAKVEALDRLTVRVSFARANRELKMIAGQLPILPRHVYDGKDFDRDFLQVAVGSGPYSVKEFEFGERIRYQRNPSYWGRELNVNVGKYNFDAIVVKYYRDNTVILEALKAGEFDFMEVSNSKEWTKDVGGDKWDKGYLVKETLPHKNTAGMQGFVFNLRRPLFQDVRVREALSLLLDFEWTNSSLLWPLHRELELFRQLRANSQRTAVTSGTGLAGTLACPASPRRVYRAHGGLGYALYRFAAAFAGRATALEKRRVGSAEWRVDRNRQRPAHAVYHHTGSGGFPAHR
jgi:microcin C transport system substrate-binding protein